jgi:hypothetical protein
MEKKKIIVVPQSFFKESQSIKVAKNLVEGYREMTEEIKNDEEQYLTDLNKKIELILESSDSNSYKLRDLIELKASIEKEKIETRYGSRKKTIEEKALRLLQIQINKLKELIQINPDLKINTKDVLIEKANEPEINSASTQINPPEPELIISFEKIIAQVPKAQIEKYFNKLARNKNSSDGKPFLNQSDVDDLLAQTIDVFPTTKRKHRLFQLNINKKQTSVIYNFVYRFYLMNEKSLAGSKMFYAEFLKNNFKNFYDLTTKSIYDRLRESREIVEKYPWLEG